MYFVTQNPLDIPDVVLGQLGNRIQHALRAFTPRERIPLPREPHALRPVVRPGDTLFEAMAKSAVRSIGSQVGRQVVRGVLGSILGGGRR